MALIETQGLKKNFGSLEVLRGIDVSISEGETVAIVGPSGSGKSTFLRCLNLLERPTAGRVFFRGKCVYPDKADEDALRASVGMVFQHFNLFPHLSVLDNLSLAPRRVHGVRREAAEEEALTLLARVGLSDKARAFPAQLSGGQKQRIAIVRALAMKPQVLLFDEPTSALDPETKEAVDELLFKRKRAERTIVFASHSMEEAALADLVVVIASGEVVASGPPERIFYEDFETGWGIGRPFACELALELERLGLCVGRPLDLASLIASLRSLLAAGVEGGRA
jgi:polar amino acid transport system ATP-binding protein